MFPFMDEDEIQSQFSLFTKEFVVTDTAVTCGEKEGPATLRAKVYVTCDSSYVKLENGDEYYGELNGYYGDYNMQVELFSREFVAEIDYEYNSWAGKRNSDGTINENKYDKKKSSIKVSGYYPFREINYYNIDVFYLEYSDCAESKILEHVEQNIEWVQSKIDAATQAMKRLQEMCQEIKKKLE